MNRIISDSLWSARDLAYLQGIFAVVALVMSAVGLYGLISQSANLRKHEFGVRLALGARPADVCRLVPRLSLPLVLIGRGLGWAGAFALTRWLVTLLHDISPTDTLTFVATSALLATGALLASYMPARRAARFDPIVALRCE